jgi:hypothetical protein
VLSQKHQQGFYRSFRRDIYLATGRTTAKSKYHPTSWSKNSLFKSFTIGKQDICFWFRLNMHGEVREEGSSQRLTQASCQARPPTVMDTWRKYSRISGNIRTDNAAWKWETIAETKGGCWSGSHHHGDPTYLRQWLSRIACSSMFFNKELVLPRTYNMHTADEHQPSPIHVHTYLSIWNR